jgi:predicted Fe-S protein YdhL (DUF1289 family)
VSEITRGVQPPVPTPCIGVCQLDEASGLCLGCARNGDEIAGWAAANGAAKLAVWAVLPQRRAGLGLAAYRLPWSADEIALFAESTLRKRVGRWRFGMEGVSVSFAIGEGEEAAFAATPQTLAVLTPRGALRLVRHEKTIAIAFGTAADPEGPRAIALVLPKGRVALGPSAGPEHSAISAAYQGMMLTPLIAGENLTMSLSARSAGEEAPHAVVQTGLGRVEYFGGGFGADGPVMEFDPARAALRQGLPDGWVLDKAFALGALFYPEPRLPLAEMERVHL